MKGELEMARIETRATRLPVVALTALWIGGLLVAAAVAEDIEETVTSPGTLEFVGKNLIMTAKGTFHEWRIVESSVDIDAIDGAFVLLEVELASVDTGIERRDDHLRNPDFFDVDTYPVATVRIHSPQPSRREANEELRFTVQYDVNLHGVEKTLDGEIVLLDTEPLIFEGNLTIDRMEFGVGPKPGFWSPMVPKAEIPVSFHIEL
jgi:polyisoprenoid-binding protein YceI